MRKILSLFVVLLCVINSRAADYTDFLTAERGFTEVTSTDDILTGDYYYIITSAENTEMIVSVGHYEAKPGWAPEETLAMRYKSTDTDPVLDPKNYFIIEKQDSYIGLRSLPYSICMFQTNDGQGYIWVNGFLYEHNMSEWDQLAPTFDNDFWIFKNQKFANDNFYLGPWNKVVADNEPIAGNRLNVEGDEAGHYRLFRISKADYESKIKQVRLNAMSEATASAPVDATWMIKNPTFDQGQTGWSISRGNPDTEATLEDLYEDNGWHTNVNGTITDWTDTKIADYGMTNKDGVYLYNSWCWWASSLSIYQLLTDVPSGRYELSATLCSHENRTVTLYGNDVQKSVTTTDAGNGIPTSLQVEVNDGTLLVKAGTTVDWWSEESTMPYTNERAIGFFKVDNFQLKCLGIFLDNISMPLPNDETTVLTPDQWYYYDAPAAGKYTLTGNLLGMVYAEGSQTIAAEVTTNPTKNEMGFSNGRVFFKTTRSDATLKVEPAMEINTFTAASLNVDGLPQSVSILLTNIEINPDGPGESGTEQISTYLQNKGYDMIAVSEDFNYHNNLTKNMGSYSWGSYRGSLSLSNVLSTADTDGLEFAWKTNALSVSDESWTKFNTSEGGLRDGANTSIKKGYRYYTANVNGVDIDVFITHMDADGENSHTSSRNAQWTEMANAIKAKNNGRPKIFMGDTNSRWTRENIKTNFMDVLSEDYDVQDTWVEMCRNGNYDGLVDESGYGWGIVNDSDPSKFSAYEVVDKIFYLNPKAGNTYRLTPQSWKLELDYINSEGNQLGDHKPCVVDFTIAYNEEVDNTVTPGDIVDGDGTNATDLEALINILMGRSESTYDLNAADMNGDGEITLSDLTALVNILLPEEE